MKSSSPPLIEVGFLKAQFTKERWGGEEKLEIADFPSFYPS